MVINPIESMPLVSPLASTGPSEAGRAVPPSTGAHETNGVGTFESILGSALDAANQADRNAAQKTAALASGAIDDLHGTMISVKEADIAVRLVGSVRNKILDAFQELWRTSV